MHRAAPVIPERKESAAMITTIFEKNSETERKRKYFKLLFSEKARRFNNMSAFEAIRREVFTRRSFVHALSGAIGGFTAISTFYPLNTVRLKLQVDSTLKEEGTFQILQNIYREQGLKGLYQGLTAQAIALGCSNFVYFYTYETFKTMYRAFTATSTIDAVPNLAIAFVAGIINVLSTTPLWVAMSRLATQNRRTLHAGQKLYKGMWDTLTRIRAEEGIGALWNGVKPSIILCSNPTIQFVAYERCRRVAQYMASRRKRAVTALDFFLCGAIAKATATVLTYPLQLAQSRLRNDKTGATTASILTKEYEEKGFAGWYRGLSAKMWQTILTAAFQFMVYEKLTGYVTFLLLGVKKPKKK